MSAMQPEGTHTKTSRDRNKAVVRRIIEAFNTGNAAIIDEIVDSNLRDHTPPPGLRPNIDGIKQQIKLLRQGFPDAHFEEETLIAEGDMVFLRWKMTGTHQGPYFFNSPPTGKYVTHYGHEIVRLKGGKIIEHRDTADAMIFMDKLGLLDEKMLTMMKDVGLRAYDAEPFR